MWIRLIVHLLSIPVLSLLLSPTGARVLSTSLPDDNSSATVLTAPGPVSECLTYDQRYEAAKDWEWLDQVADELNPASTRAVLLKLHVADPPHEDLLRSLHALAIEAMESGWHFFILLQGRQELTRKETLHFLPKGLRQFVVVHDHHNTLRMYPRLEAAFQQPAEDAEFGPGMHGAYLAETAFMHQYRKYTYLFVVEYDARLVGHWGHFFDHSLRKAEEAQGHDLMAVLGDDQHSLQNATNATKSGPADLIVYTQPTYGDKWKASATNLNMTHGWDTFIMVYGASRKTFNVLHDMSLKGQSLYVEALLPTAAMIHGLRFVARNGASPYHEAYHCCSGDAERLYQQFALNQTCTKSILLHPIKRDVTKPELPKSAQSPAE